MATGEEVPVFSKVDSASNEIKISIT